MSGQSKLRWRVLGFLFLISVITYVDRVNIAVAGAALGREFGLTRVELGAVFSAFVLGYALFQVPGGWLGDRFGHKRVLALALVWWSIFTVLTAWAGQSFLTSALGLVPAFAVVRGLIGVGEAAAYPCAAGLVQRWFPATERGRANGIIFSGIGVGLALTPPIVAWLMVSFGWQSAFYLSGAAGAALATAFYLFVAEGPDAGGRSSRGRLTGIRTAEITRSDGAPGAHHERVNRVWARILKNPQVWLLTASAFFVGYVLYIFFSWFYLYLVEVRGFTLLRGSLFAALPFAAMALGATAGGVFSDRLGSRLGKARARRTVVALGFIPATCLLYLGAGVANPYYAIGALALAAGFLTLPAGAAWATASELEPSYAATVMGITSAGANLGGVLSPVLTPWIAARYGWVTALGAGAAAILAAGVLWKFIGVPEAEALESARPSIRPRAARHQRAS